ncbi:hypothetical protein HWV62_20956 [Athelia sp. TMB]|nr:hypothetical protein HWV62_20956 [Athelia sp. TMB]
MSDVAEKSNYSEAEEKGQIGLNEDLLPRQPANHGAMNPDGFQSPEEKALVWKLDKRILPITCLLYLFAYLDRTNLGNARLQGLPQDTLGGDPSGLLYNWVNSAFFFTYIIFQIPATVASKLYPPHYWMGCAAIGWGLCSTLMVCLLIA